MSEVFSAGSDRQQLIARRERLLGPAYRLFYENPVHIVRGEGVWLIDADGNILKLRPPMVFSKENADFFLGHLDEVLATV